MKTNVNKIEFLKAVQQVRPAASGRSTLPVLAMIALEQNGPMLKLSATDLEMGIVRYIECEPGSADDPTKGVCAPAKVLEDLLSSMPGSRVTLFSNPLHKLSLVGTGDAGDSQPVRGSNAMIAGIDVQEFPPMPAHDQTGLPIAAHVLRRMIDRVAFAASTEEARPVLQNVHIQAANEKLTMVATDGFRVSIAEEDYPTPIPPILLGAKALGVLAKMLAGTGMVNYRADHDRGIFTAPDWMVAIQASEGNFPDFRVIIPRKFVGVATLKASALLGAVRQAEMLHAAAVKLDFSDDQVIAHGFSEETGEYDTTLNCRYDGPPMSIAFNPAYLKHGLEVAGSEEVELRLGNEKSPVLLRMTKDAAWQYVVMPIHLS